VSRRWLILVVLVAAATGAVATLVIFGRSERTRTLDEILAGQPAPDLSTLAERSRPGRAGKDVFEAHYDILKLRELADPSAVPVLKEILADHSGSTHIHGYAAAQALYSIGTPECHEILERHLLSPDFSASYGIAGVFGWPKGDGLVRRYYLRHLAKDLTLTLALGPAPKRTVAFVVTAKNISNAPLDIVDQKLGLGRLLFFRSADGVFAPVTMIARYRAGHPGYVKLKPGQSHSFRIEVEAKSTGASTRGPALATGHMEWSVEKLGRFQVWAMLEVQPLPKAMWKQWKLTNPWSGRAVAGPVDVVIE